MLIYVISNNYNDISFRQILYFCFQFDFATVSLGSSVSRPVSVVLKNVKMKKKLDSCETIRVNATFTPPVMSVDEIFASQMSTRLQEELLRDEIRMDYEKC